jgi:hypothetical protein
MANLRAWVWSDGRVTRSTDPDPRSTDVIPGLENPIDPGIKPTLDGSVRTEYRA